MYKKEQNNKKKLIVTLLLFLFLPFAKSQEGYAYYTNPGKWGFIDKTGRLLKVTREGYKNGHWWQDGVFNLSKYTISWNSKITR